MQISILLFPIIMTLVTAIPIPIIDSPVTAGLSLTADSTTATILFDLDGNEARANFRVPVPGKQVVNQRLLAVSVQAINNLGSGQNKMDVVCQAFNGGGEVLGQPFDLLTRVVLSGNERKQVMVGSIECRLIRGGLGAKVS